jgi:large subunit ribosomal protein L9
MEVILIKDIPPLGRAGDVVKVKSGYARNYLIPKRLALAATADNTKRFEALRKREGIDREKEKLSAQALKEKIEAVSITLKKNAGEEGKLFGSVTSHDIVDALGDLGVEVDKRKIVIEEQIKRLGDYVVSIKLGSDVLAHLPVTVVKEE